MTRTKTPGLSASLLLLLALGVAACSSKEPIVHSPGRGVVVHGPVQGGHARTDSQPRSGVSNDIALRGIDLRPQLDLDGIISRLDNVRVVFVGETHDLYGHHLAQLQVIKALHQKHPDLAIGMEMFQQPFQQYLDAYIDGRIDEAEMLRKTEWFDRWRYDFRHYKPILDYAKRHKIPVIALNIPFELKDRVSQVGLKGLTAEERARIPADMDDSDMEYRERLRTVFHRHAGGGTRNGFERFVQVQLLWDESMAERAARYLQEHPERRLVVLAGGGHLMYGSGIPNRVKRRVDVETAIILPGDKQPVRPGMADFLIYPPEVSLPKAGLMGVYLDEAEQGVLISAVAEESAAGAAGIRKGDVITRVNGAAVKTSGDVKALLLGKKPGDSVTVSIFRDRLLFEDQHLEFTFRLGG